VATALIALIGVITFGLQMLLRSKEMATATEVGREVMERIKVNVRTLGLGYLPVGSYVFDGRIPAPASGAPLFPPGPYPVANANGGTYPVVVSGQEIGPRLKAVTVEVYYSATGKILLNTRMHP
jgi:hypothetical protein